MESVVIPQSPTLEPVTEIVEHGSETEEWSTGNEQGGDEEPSSRLGQSRASSPSPFSLNPCDIVSDQWETLMLYQRSPYWGADRRVGSPRGRKVVRGLGSRKRKPEVGWPGNMTRKIGGTEEVVCNTDSNHQLCLNITHETFFLKVVQKFRKSLLALLGMESPMGSTLLFFPSPHEMCE